MMRRLLTSTVMAGLIPATLILSAGTVLASSSKNADSYALGKSSVYGTVLTAPSHGMFKVETPGHAHLAVTLGSGYRLAPRSGASTLSVGDAVLASGAFYETLTASVVKFGNSPFPVGSPLSTNGVVDYVSSSQLGVGVNQNTTVNMSIGRNTKITLFSNPATASQLTDDLDGDGVAATYHRLTDGSYLANTITITQAKKLVVHHSSPAPGLTAQPALLFGTIASGDTSGLVIDQPDGGSITILPSASVPTYDENANPAPAAVGDYLEARGTFSNTFTPEAIWYSKSPFGVGLNFTTSGTIGHHSQSVLTVNLSDKSSNNYTMVSSTVFRLNGSVVSASKALANGRKVSVIGQEKTDGDWFAVEVDVKK